YVLSCCSQVLLRLELAIQSLAYASPSDFSRHELRARLRRHAQCAGSRQAARKGEAEGVRLAEALSRARRGIQIGDRGEREVGSKAACRPDLALEPARAGRCRGLRFLVGP